MGQDVLQNILANFSNPFILTGINIDFLRLSHVDVNCATRPTTMRRLEHEHQHRNS